MSEEKQHRSPQEIHQEYSQLCAEIGDMEIKKEGFAAEKTKRMARAIQLNLEVLESNAYYARLQSELQAMKNEKPQS